MPKPTPLHEVLNNTKCYAIPDYQRDYAWHASNVETLCLDILAVAFGKETEDEHFIGTLVTVPFDKKEATSMAIDLDDSLYGESNEPRHVVDGQQRLATLSLIVKVLLDMVMEDPAIENPRARDSLRKRLEDMIYQAGPEQPGNFPFPILILNGNTGVVFNELLTGRKIPCNKKYTGAKRVNAAVQTIRKIIGDERHWQADLSGYDAYAFYNRIVETLHKKILLVEIECCDSINAFQVFDSLNGKGLDLTAAADRCERLRDRLPDASVGLLHGQMTAEEKDAAMRAFIAGETNILVSTTVIEVGVDVPNASVMVIEHAERFGLAQLHQLRGRVGRGSAKSFCLLLFDPNLSEEGRRRLSVIRATNDGFEVARHDLQLRGPGEFLGERQSGVPMLRFADLERDEALLVNAARWAPVWLEKDREAALEHARRWFKTKTDYLGI